MEFQQQDISVMMARFEKACREADLKVTHQRLEIYRELVQAKDHPSAEIVYQRIKNRLPTISLDTVYRTLSTFEKHRLVNKIHSVESQARFEANMTQHHHAVCIHCGTITDFNWNSFDEVRVPKELSEWGEVIGRNATLAGVCKVCVGKK